jgi:LPS-assembly lipoprotein
MAMIRLTWSEVAFRRPDLRLAAQLALLLLPLLLFAGCGFQPRGQVSAVSAVYSPLHVAGLAANSALRIELEQQLRGAGAELTSNPAEAAAILHLARLESATRVLSVDSFNKAVELELEESVRVVLRPAGAGALSPQTFRAVRILYQPGDAILASHREATVLRSDMQRELATRIARHLGALR